MSNLKRMIESHKQLQKGYNIFPDDGVEKVFDGICEIEQKIINYPVDNQDDLTYMLNFALGELDTGNFSADDAYSAIRTAIAFLEGNKQQKAA